MSAITAGHRQRTTDLCLAGLRKKLCSGASICLDEGHPQSRAQVGNTLPVHCHLYKVPSLPGSSPVSLFPASSGKDTRLRRIERFPSPNKEVRALILCAHILAANALLCQIQEN